MNLHDLSFPSTLVIKRLNIYFLNIMALSLKRSCLPFASTYCPLKKCRKTNDHKKRSLVRREVLLPLNRFHSSSEEEDSDDYYDDEYNDYDDDNNGYENLSPRRKLSLRRRSSTRSAAETPLNIELSRAVALYSDDDDEDEEENKSKADTQVKQRRKSKTGSLSCHETKDNQSSSSVKLMKSSMSETDRAARARCLDYLVGAIDEVWAMYCDATSYAEDETYGYEPNTPASISISENEEYSDASLAETEITDYAELDINLDSKLVQKNKQEQAKHQTSLQNLKDRLTNAKYYLQDYVDSDDFADCLAFWKRWDVVKYCTIELVEDEDEDDVVENTIEELENGRCPATI